MLKTLNDLTAALQEIIDDTDYLTEHTQNTVGALTKLVECKDYKGFTLICSDEEIKKTIDENFTIDHSLSIGYNDGQFALVFCEADDEQDNLEKIDTTEEYESDNCFEIVTDPYFVKVIATGDEECYEDVRMYVEKFLDNLDK